MTPRFLTIAFCAIVLAGCGREKAAPAPKAQAVPAVVMTVTATDVPNIAEFVGETESSQEVEIRARVEGFLESISYDEGSIVQKGAVLFQMDRKPFEASLAAARAELEAQQARLATAAANLKRVGPLAAEDALSQKDLDDAQGSRDAAVAAVEGARSRVQQAEINLSYTTIRSPLTGVTSFARKQPGSFVCAGTGQPAHVRIGTRPDARQLQRVRERAAAIHPARRREEAAPSGRRQVHGEDRPGRRHDRARAGSRDLRRRLVQQGDRHVPGPRGAAEQGRRTAARPVRPRTARGRHLDRRTRGAAACGDAGPAGQLRLGRGRGIEGAVPPGHGGPADERSLDHRGRTAGRRAGRRRRRDQARAWGHGQAGRARCSRRASNRPLPRRRADAEHTSP